MVDIVMFATLSKIPIAVLMLAKLLEGLKPAQNLGLWFVE